MSGQYGRAPGTRAGKKAFVIGVARNGEPIVWHLSKTGRSKPGHVALRLKPRRRRATWGPNAFLAVKVERGEASE